MTRLVLASLNAHKLDEVRQILEGTGVEVLDLRAFPELGEPPEDGATFAANALQKAIYVHERTGLPVVADDSGLEVDALGGAPGVRSRRYTPEATAEANNAALLAALDGVTDRRARFRCAMALVLDGQATVVEGTCEGRILTSPRGAGGFGYDPLFEADALPGRSLAELRPDEKNGISHRGAAFRQLPGLLSAPRPTTP
jgi:XTP/dITP diphosphohydrolase